MRRPGFDTPTRTDHRTGRWSATSCKPWRSTAPGRPWRAGRTAQRGRASDRHRFSDRMMQAVGAARHGVLQPYLLPGTRRSGRSIFADAMHGMKEVRAVPPAADRSRQTGALPAWCFPASTRIPGAGSGGFPAPHERAVAERRAGKADRTVGHPGACSGWRRRVLSKRPRDRLRTLDHREQGPPQKSPRRENMMTPRRWRHDELLRGSR